MATSQSAALIATNAVFLGLAILAVAMRIYARKHKVLYLQADDYLILAALLFSAGLVVTNILGAAIGGFGVPFSSLTEDEAVLFLKILFIEQFWYIISVGLVKLSVLCFYGRLFSARRFPRIIWVFIAITIGWTISFLFATFFQVWPIWCNWTNCVPTTNYPVMYVCSSVTDIVLDISILCLPAGFVRKLQISRSQKMGVISIFGLGIFCIIASLARLVYTVILVQVNVDADFGANFGSAVVFMILWSGIEACASIICANLPCYAPLYHNSPLKSFINSMRSRSAARSSRGKPLEDSGGSNSLPLRRIESSGADEAGGFMMGDGGFDREGKEGGVYGGGGDGKSGVGTVIRGGGGYFDGGVAERGRIKVDVTVGVQRGV